MKVTIKLREIGIFTISSFLILLMILLIYASLTRDGLPLSWEDIKENYIYILVLFAIFDLITCLSKGYIQISTVK